MFKSLKELFEATYKTTAKKGIPALEKELFDCNATLNKHLNDLGSFLFFFKLYYLLRKYEFHREN